MTYFFGFSGSSGPSQLTIKAPSSASSLSDAFSFKFLSDLRSVSVAWEKTLAEWDTSGSSCTVGDLVDEAEEGGSLAKSGMVETSFVNRG